LGGFLAGLIVGAFVLYYNQAYSVGFSQADEPSHFINGLFVARYITQHFGDNPIAVATEYYLHYPKITFGHWPPAFYGLLGVLFLAVPASTGLAFAVNFCICAAVGAGVAAFLAKLVSARLAIIGALLVAISPLVIEAQSVFLLDQAVAAVSLAAAMLWYRFASRPTWPGAFAFCAIAAFAVLVKGTGWLLIFLPIIHLTMTNQWRALASAKIYVAAACAGAIVVPWYLMTTAIAADGFNYKPGLGYAGRALQGNALTLLENLGLAGVALATVGISYEWHSRSKNRERWSLVCACLSLTLATLILQSLVPADIVARYMAPALPGLLVLAIIGIAHIATLVQKRSGTAGAALTIASLTLIIAWPGIKHLSESSPKVAFHLDQVAREIGRSSAAAIWVIDGTEGAEGSLVVEAALRDPGLTYYIARSSKLFASSDFMGRRYQLKFENANGFLGELQRLGVAGVVQVRPDGGKQWPHNKLLAQALALPQSPYSKSMTLKHDNGNGVTEVFTINTTPKPDFVALRQIVMPTKIPGRK